MKVFNIISLGIAKSCPKITRKVKSGERNCVTKLWNELSFQYANSQRIAKTLLIMDLVDCSSVIPEGSWDDYSTDIHCIIDSYNSTGEPLTVEDLAAALALQSILKSERYGTLGASLLDQE
eukprot:2648871-Rhodomonas_salina.1